VVYGRSGQGVLCTHWGVRGLVGPLIVWPSVRKNSGSGGTAGGKLPPTTSLPPDPRDPRTWPATISAAEIEELLKPILKEGASISYTALQTLTATGEFDSASRLFTPCLQPTQMGPLDVQKYLDKHLNNVDQLIAMELVERSTVIDKLARRLEPTPGNSKRRVISMYSCRGSGKTAVLKYLAGNTLYDSTAAGRIIVRDCSAAKTEDWMKQLLDERNPSAALCSLVCAHVREVTGQPMKPEPGQDLAQVYEQWIRATKERFNLNDKQSSKLRPIILLDTCEKLAVPFPQRKHRPSENNPAPREYTVLEAFCFEVPVPEAIVAFGCNASIDMSDPTILTEADVTTLSALPPLSFNGYREATGIRCWKSQVDFPLVRPLYELAGGIPRLLRAAHKPFRISLAGGAWKAVSTGMKLWREDCQGIYEYESGTPHKYSLMLASSTKFPVTENQEVILPPDAELTTPSTNMTYREASEKSMCAQVWNDVVKTRNESIRVVVPPILLTDETNFGMSKVPIKPSELHPLLGEENLKKLRSSPDKRGCLFEKPFLHSLYARYLLVWWRKLRTPSSTGQFLTPTGPDSGWVPLGEVLAGALSAEGRAKLQGIEVCLQDGLQNPESKSGDYNCALANSVTWTGGVNPSAHHDAYIWCRAPAKASASFGGVTIRDADPVTNAMALQLRHGQPKENEEIYRQTFEKPDGQHHLALPLLVVYRDWATRDEGERRWKNIALKRLSEDQRKALPSRVVFVDASAMSSTAWLDLVSVGEENGGEGDSAN
jgi:hypothetical protein